MSDSPKVVLAPYAALVEDVALWRPELRPCLEKGYSRLEKLILTRGIRIVMIDLPDLGSAFDKGLSSGYLNINNLPHVMGSWKKGTFILKDFFLLCFDEHGAAQTPDPNDVFFLRQILYLWKKVKKECSNDSLNKAVTEFRRIEERLSPPSLNWCDDRLCIPHGMRLRFSDRSVQDTDWFSDRRAGCPDILLRCLDQVAGLVISRFPVLKPECLSPKHGPGAVADVKTGNDKYDFPNWPRKLDLVFPAELFAQHREDLHREVDLSRSRHEPPAKLLAVPKTLKSPRLIASEPTAHQFLQQGLLRWIRENLPTPLSTSINFLSQEPSREIVLAASRDTQLATVDLSSASDRLSCWVIERIFQYNWSMLSALHSVRTRWLVNATGSDQEFSLKLKKYAAQGSAVTFPLQSIVYTICCYAVLLYLEGKKPNWANLRKVARKVRVFGDDIILPSHAVWDLSLLLEYLELKVNEKKTHWQGNFRESCGMDGYRGYNVSPIYLSYLEIGTTADRLQSWIDVSNNAHISGLFRLAKWMKDQVPENVQYLIPTSNYDLPCIRLATFSDGLSCSKKRFSKTLHRDETLGLQVKVHPVWQGRDSYQSLLQYFLERPDPDTNWRSGYLVRKRLTFVKRWVLT